MLAACLGWAFIVTGCGTPETPSAPAAASGAEGRPFVDAKGNPVERVHVYGARWDLLPPGYESVYEGKPPP